MVDSPGAPASANNDASTNDDASALPPDGTAPREDIYRRAMDTVNLAVSLHTAALAAAHARGDEERAATLAAQRGSANAVARDLNIHEEDRAQGIREHYIGVVRSLYPEMPEAALPSANYSLHAESISTLVARGFQDGKRDAKGPLVFQVDFRMPGADSTWVDHENARSFSGPTLFLDRAVVAAHTPHHEQWLESRDPQAGAQVAREAELLEEELLARAFAQRWHVVYRCAPGDLEVAERHVRRLKEEDNRQVNVSFVVDSEVKSEVLEMRHHLSLNYVNGQRLSQRQPPTETQLRAAHVNMLAAARRFEHGQPIEVDGKRIPAGQPLADYIAVFRAGQGKLSFENQVDQRPGVQRWRRRPRARLEIATIQSRELDDFNPYLPEQAREMRQVQYSIAALERSPVARSLPEDWFARMRADLETVTPQDIYDIDQPEPDGPDAAAPRMTPPSWQKGWPRLLRRG